MGERSDWASPALKEVPFWRDGMGVDEYDREREYFAKNYDALVKKGKYVPLWKQRVE